MRVVVDANVAIKWAVPEAGTERALRVLDADPVVPDLFFAEVANVLWKKVRRGELSDAEAASASEALLVLDYDVAPTASLLRTALDLACRTGHPAYDFHYVALAQPVAFRS
ncbi:type II toxin-antitoxin system VapC family toxin [Azospirillum halopraeferens]|uniref:type II toxin-antitoxin system VapC family toxin n=1 Tax=Azospirillum halopraeferens TaxID=34010 RepID=UPI000407CF37|nr:type II toxin-antitoxin system VapC family toxin [Azospirillum halopraeferens]